MIYMLNTPILTAYGRYDFTGPLDPENARHALEGAAAITSAIGHESSAVFLSRLLRMPIVPNRVAVTMEPGDEALVLRLKERLPEGKILSAKEMADFPYELGWLRRME